MENMSKPSDGLLAEVAARLAEANSIAVLSGAGVSAESGIPTFRDAQTGLWEKYDPVMLASPEGFAENPARVWRWYDERRQKMTECEPNPGHHVLAEWERSWRGQGRSFQVITQNIDDLHARSGSQDVIELHGNIWYVRGMDDGMHEAFKHTECPLKEHPLKDSSGRLLRPHVVWFGEMLAPAVLNAAIKLAETCDAMIVAGTSSMVYPAAALPFGATRRNALVVEVNPNPTQLTPEASYSLRGGSGVILPRLWELVQQAA